MNIYELKNRGKSMEQLFAPPPPTHTSGRGGAY